MTVAVFFTSAQQLSDNASSGESNLYESVCVLPRGDHGEEPAAKERVRWMFLKLKGQSLLLVARGCRV